MSNERWLARLTTVGSVALLMTLPAVGLPSVDPAQPVVVSSITTLLKLTGATALVCLVFWAAARVMKQLQRVGARSQGRLRIVESVSVGQRERILIIQAGSEQMVIGVTGQQINRLHTLAEPLDCAVSPVDVPPHGDFRTKLQMAMKRSATS